MTMKVRKNITIDSEVLEMLKKLAKAQKTTVSALITRWVLERAESLPPSEPAPPAFKAVTPIRRARTNLKPKPANTNRG